MHRLAELDAASFTPGHVVAGDERGWLNWGDLVADVSSLRARFRAAGCARWALYHGDSYLFTAGLLALLAEGLEVFLPAENHRGMVDALNAQGAALAGEFGGAERVVLSRAANGQAVEEFALSGSVVVFTSGSTGNAKPIAKSLRQFDAELAALEQSWGAALAGALIGGTVSHQHIYGLLFIVLWPLCAGRRVWRRPFVDPSIMAATLAAEGANAWVMSPAHLHRLDAALPWAQARGATALVFSSGGPLEQRAAAAVFERLGKYPIEVLGSSETGGIAWRHQTVLGEPWQPLPGLEVRLEGEELAVRSAWQEDDGWYLTADRATLEADGRFVLGARSDRIVKVEGKRVALPEVESALLQHDYVADCSVVVLQRRRQVLGALLELSAEGTERHAALGHHHFTRELRRFLVNRLAAAAVPRVWRVIGAMPRNSQGKLRHKDVLRRFASGTLPPVTSREELGGGGRRLLLHAPTDSPYFEGHFREAPILPGVVQLRWAEQLARDELGLAGEFAGMRGVKFTAVTFPLEQLVLDLRWDAASGELRFTYESTRGRHSEGTLLYHRQVPAESG
ncbi:MAG: AMP-binding protein [Halioglobus sp.]|nr:AMP-binding protein [Halioglobus sp.]